MLIVRTITYRCSGGKATLLFVVPGLRHSVGTAGRHPRERCPSWGNGGEFLQLGQELLPPPSLDPLFSAFTHFSSFCFLQEEKISFLLRKWTLRAPNGLADDVQACKPGRSSLCPHFPPNFPQIPISWPRCQLPRGGWLAADPSPAAGSWGCFFPPLHSVPGSV